MLGRYAVTDDTLDLATIRSAVDGQLERIGSEPRGSVRVRGSLLHTINGRSGASVVDCGPTPRGRVGLIRAGRGGQVNAGQRPAGEVPAI